MTKEEIIDLLNKDRANELIAIAQYMNHHYQAVGEDFLEVRALFKETALKEMAHAEKLGERISLLGGDPVTKPQAVQNLSAKQVAEGGSINEMVQADLGLEKSAINDYSEHIRMVGDADPVTRRMLEDILADEEEHADNFGSWLGLKEIPFELRVIKGA